MMTSNHILTNKDISENYSDCEFYLMLNDFIGAFSCWIIRQDNSESFNLAIKAIEAYSNFLKKTKFPNKENVEKMDCEQIKYLTSESIFESIPEILAMNEIEKDFVSLGALSRNVFYHILREQITQPL